MGDLNDNTIFNEVDPLNNSTGQPSFPEGMLPSVVDDNNRALMGAVKRNYNHMNGQVTVSGTGNAIILTYPVSPYLCLKGDRYAFTPIATNTGATTVKIGDLAAYEVLAYNASLIGGEFVVDVPVEIVFDGTHFQFMNRIQGGTLGNGTGALHLGSATLTSASIGTVAASSVVATTTIESDGFYKLSGKNLIDGNSTYHTLYDGAGNPDIFMGGVADPANYYRNTTHFFQPILGNGPDFARLDASGLVMNGTLAVTGALKLNNLAITPTVLSIEAYGGVADGVTDNSAALVAALAASPVGKPCVRFGPGRYAFAARVVISVADHPGAALNIAGQGSDVTELYFPNASGGFDITFVGQGGSVYMHDLSLLTAHAGTATAVSITGPSVTALAPENGPMSVFANLILRSSETYQLNGGTTTNYWTNGFIVTRMSNVTWNTVTQIGHLNNGGYSTLGSGIVIAGGSDTYIPVIYNVTNCQFLAVGTGFVYGDRVQGVFVLNSNFVACETGILVPADEINTDQLIVNGCQFNCSSANIDISSTFADLLVTGSLFLSPANGIGVFIANNVEMLRSAITGCAFGGTSVGVGTGIVAGAGSNGDISLTNCGFQFLASDFFFGANTSGWVVQNNHGDIVFTNDSAANIIDWPQDITSSVGLTFTGASTGITYSSKVATYSRRGKEVWVDIEFYLTSKGSATGPAIITGLPVAAANYNFSIIVYAVNMTGLTSQVTGLVSGNGSAISLLTNTATGNVAISETVFTNTSQITCSAHYRTA